MSRRPADAVPPLARMLAWTVAGALLLAGCAPSPPRPDIVLITIDTLRADHLSSYGYGRITSPFLDSLARKGSLFTNCRATSSWTAPSMASIFTGLHPLKHGVRNGLFQKDGDGLWKGAIGQEVLDPSFLTLAETLKAAGYATYGISSNQHVTEATGMGQGFDRFFGLGFCDAAQVNETALSLKDELDAGGPHFLWIHYFDPHVPYEARAPWRDRYANDATAFGKGHGVAPDNQDGRVSDEILARLKPSLNAYDSEINFTDDHVRQLFDAGLVDADDWVIITSDHGEEFGEHDDHGHGKTLFDEVLAVPLIMVAPSEAFANRGVTVPVSIVDIHPTIVDHLGLDEAAAFDGQSLLGLLRGSTTGDDRVIYSELTQNRPLKSVLIGASKYIKPTQGEPGTFAREDPWKMGGLFDLAADPWERDNLIDARPDLAQRMDAELERWTREETNRDLQGNRVVLTPEEMERLKAVGY